MSDGGNTESMGTGAQNPLENDMDRYLTNKASAFKYPPTPDIASAVRNKLVGESIYKARDTSQHRPRRAWAAMALMAVVVLGALLAVPQVRGLVGDVYTSVVRIFKSEPGPVPVPNVPTLTPVPPWASKLVGETDFGNAQLQMSCNILIPGYPLDLGQPNQVFFQDINGGNTVILVWLDPAHPDKPRMALYVFTDSTTAFGLSGILSGSTLTSVQGQEAHWASGSQSAEVYDSTGITKLAKIQIVDGNVLVWKAGAMDNHPGCTNLTYRLETGLSMDEALNIANSLQTPDPVPTPVPTNTPAPTTTPVSPSSALNLAGEVNGLLGLSDAAGFPVKIPVLTSKPDLIGPSRLFLQDLGGPAVIMAWYTPGRTDDLQLVLYQIKGMDKFADRTASSTTLVQEITVHGNRAKWVQGPHMIYTVDNQNGQTLEPRSFISNSHALVWEENGMSYRLETAGTLQEAVEIAEGLNRQ